MIYFDHSLYNLTMDDQVRHIKSMLEILRNKTLYSNSKKQIFRMDHEVFLGFIVISKEV